MTDEVKSMTEIDWSNIHKWINSIMITLPLVIKGVTYRNKKNKETKKEIKELLYKTFENANEYYTKLETSDIKKVRENTIKADLKNLRNKSKSIKFENDLITEYWHEITKSPFESSRYQTEPKRMDKITELYNSIFEKL